MDRRDRNVGLESSKDFNDIAGERMKSKSKIIQSSAEFLQ
jgi:hypothetical protein